MPVLEAGDLAALFRNVASSVFRLETLPVYNPVSEADRLRSYLAGEPCPKDREPTPYMRRVADQTGRGIDCWRVHVFTGPPTDYLRYEMEWGYAYNARCGERILLLDTAEQPRPEGLLDQDFWLFDDTHVVVMNYRDDGEFRHPELLAAPDLAHYRAQRDLAAANAVLFNEYWEAHPEYHRN
ncbi:phosphatidylserine/phosphatidylglycerophosphate/cardiolipin synthase family protein [Streptomonospora nanhaiensis]|uniref:Phosphatidylserine/phosphatidylglycerophosphate/ cardiolipin synthase-like enzyme n=1 Tax=Streptomonospora nanhaiensis TaxID=1323731 RepID=A0A853BMG8_9ACTN|nr:phosphatidylserine/phosphatidylglycerophosphate/cardiolipin synthase family protein [Streptomonospora nanhaiensis]MBV2365122.1 hypothetical protein [Streptomonospora nanhaiensis]MBX9388219.1 hypothetical protein [Streptomonospora nanhaiensis]NYI96668.1 phosphatidylserine/phosphatidylglycerophosphate/cardiolipin synthase-like enzyme [Streptomonospora nanhaiensis]